MPYSLAAEFKPTYIISTQSTETTNDFSIHTVEWNGRPKVRINEPAAHAIKVGFIQIVKTISIKVTYQQTIVELKLPSTPMCDCDPATDAPWYEPSTTPVAAGYSPEVAGPVNQVVEPYMSDRPWITFGWTRGAGNNVQAAERQQSFQTWLVVNDQTANTYTSLFCFAYSIHQVVSFDVTKPLGKRCKIEAGQQRQAKQPTFLNDPIPPISPKAFVAQGANGSMFLVVTPRIH